MAEMTPERIAALKIGLETWGFFHKDDMRVVLDALARAQQEIADLRRQAQAWAQYAFNHHGNDAVLYNGLADLGGVTPDGEGWLAPRTPGEKA